MVESWFFGSGLIVLMLWGLAWIGVRGRINHLIHSDVSVQQAVGDQEFIFFYLMREGMWYLLKLGLAAFVCLVTANLTGISQQVSVVIVYTLTRMINST